jgi:hypothetical protein
MHLRTVVTLTLLASGLACKGSTAPSTPAYVGTYTLMRANGNTLPYTYPQTVNGLSFTLNSGTLQLLANSNWTESLNMTPSYVGPPPNGTYTVSASTITFTRTSDGSGNIGTLSNNILTVSFNGSPSATLVFTKN